MLTITQNSTLTQHEVFMRSLLHQVSLGMIFLLLSGSALAAAPLGPVALYQRCYGQLTQQFPAANDPHLLRVQAGQQSPIDACLDILAKAALVNSEDQARLPPDAAASSIQAFQNMHKVHVSWFQERDFNIVQEAVHMRGIQDIYDAEGPALSFTRALFRPATGIDSVLTMNRRLRALRTTQNPEKGVGTQTSRADTVFGANVPFAAVGALQGFMQIAPTAYDYQFDGRTGQVAIDRAYGGGVLGDPAYLRLNLNEEVNFVSNGTLAVPRKWSRSVVSDFLCRSLPVARSGDVGSFRVRSSSASFRTQIPCLRCHATMDRMAGVIRGIRYQPIGNTSTWRADFVRLVGVSKPAEATWPTQDDAEYSLRPTNGVLFFRDYKGRLVNQPVGNLQDLGAALVATDDFYICAAKRYYSYFMGIDVKLEDPSDPQNPIFLSDRDKYHLQRVIDLGLQLKNDKNPMTLLKGILTHPDYGMDNFNSK